MDSEKSFMKSFLSNFYEINTKGEVRLTRNPVAAIRNQGEFDLLVQSYWLKKISKGMTILGWFYMPPPQQLSEAINTSYERFYAMAEPDFDWEKGPGDYKHKIRYNFTGLVDTMTSMLEGAFRKIHGLYLRTDSQRNGVKIIIALRRYKNSHGTWPKSLGEIKDTLPTELLVDPVNDGSYVYKLTEDGFELYSQGVNNIDEGGDRRTEKEDGIKADDILFWPKRDKKRETKKEPVNGG